MSSASNEVLDNPLSSRKQLYEIYANKSATARSKKRLIESLDEIYGYDLLFLVGLIMKSSFSGNLNIINQNEEVSGISFNEGKITRIDLNDKETFMGELLVNDGYISRDQLNEALKDKSKPLGEVLVLNKIETLEIIIQLLIKQIRLRLSRYINETKYRVNFSETEPENKSIFITYQDFLTLCHDQIAGRFNPEWLKLHYMELSEGQIEHLQSEDEKIIEDLPLIVDLKKVFATKPGENQFEKLFSSIKNEKDSEYFLKCIHFATMSGQIAVISDENVGNENLLKKIYHACKNKTGVDLVETLAHIVKCKPTEIDLIFQNVNNYVAAYEGDDLDMKNNMFRIVLEMLSKKQSYAAEVNKKYSQETIPQNPVTEKMMTDIFSDLINKKAYPALDKLKKIQQFSSSVPKIKLYTVWAKCIIGLEQNIKINILELDREFLQILPEDKDTAEYFYVKSMIQINKKDLKSAEDSYQKAVKAKPMFEKYQPKQLERSFMKKIFKFSIILILVSASISQAAENRPPFVYLNQYFNYQVDNSANIKINDSVWSLDDLAITLKDKKAKVELRRSLSAFNKDSEVGIIGTDGQYKKLSSGEKISSLEINPNQLNNSLICVTKNNEYTKITLCRNGLSQNVGNLSKATANTKDIEPAGTVILNDNTDNINFKVTYADKSSFELITKKRSVWPVKIEKDKGSEDFEMNFVDAANDKYKWNADVSISQTYFPLRFDNLISLRQGIFFNDSITKEISITKSYNVKAATLPEGPKNNIITVEPIFVFNEISGKSIEINATLRSGTGMGIGLAYEHILNPKERIIADGTFYTTKMSPTNDAATISEDKTSLMSLSGCYKYYLTEKLSLSGLVKIQEEMFFNKETATSVVLTKSMTKSLGLIPEYEFYQNKSWLISGLLGAYFMFSNKVENVSATKSGLAFAGAVKAKYNLKWGNLVGGMYLYNRSQKNDTYDYKEASLIYRVGFNYPF